jgi:hypothetical protein
MPSVQDHQAGAPAGGGASPLELVDTGSNPYPGNDATKEQIASWMGQEAQQAGLPAELPVMAGLTESGLSNLDHGDADSLGFFQMRASVWDHGAYAGYSQDPELQMKWFIAEATKVREDRIAEGLPDPTGDPSAYGNWIADVEHPLAIYRGRYQLRLFEAQHLLARSAATAGAQHADTALDSLPADVSPAAAAALAAARSELGVPYQWGGESPSTGFDCSGLMQWAYEKAGITLPRTSELQIGVGTPVDREHLMPGDLVFFRDATGDVHHVGMYIGDDKFIQAPHTGDVVKISSLSEPYYAQQFTGGRRMG